MDTLTILLTRHPLWNLPSTAIRAALPRSAFSIARSSHAIVVDGDYCIEAKMLYLSDGRFGTGVRRVKREVALEGAQVVAEIAYRVPDADRGLTFARAQVGKPYDFKGAVGLSLDPGRDWAQDDCWFCYELAGATVQAAGLPLFATPGHLTERELLGVNADFLLSFGQSK